MSTLRIIPLGGLGEVGKNMTVVENDGTLVLVDAGVRFPTAEMHGVDLVLPDFSYVRERAANLEAVILTHGHEDHIGAVPWVYRELPPECRPPVIARRLTGAMAQSKLDEHKLSDVPVERLEPGRQMAVGPLTVELVHMTHSIPDAAAVALTSDLGTVLFTGDYRFDHTPVDGRPPDLGRLARFAQDGLLLLCGDSTNADRAGHALSESEVGPHLEQVFSRCEGRIVVTSFASNIHRVQQVIAAAEALDRRVVLLGRSMVRNVKIGRSLGHVRADRSTLVEPRDMEALPDDGVVIVTTGSQGEPLSALRRMAYGEHRQIRLHKGDTIVFSATPIPGNERAIEETIDRLYQLGASVVTARDAPIHTSGHGHREELKLMLNLTRPRYLMPVHGDNKMLRRHAELARSLGIPPDHIFVGENGRPLEIDERGARFGDRVQAGVMLVDGIELGDTADAALRDRRVISADGIMFAVVTVTAQTLDTLRDTEIVLRGVPLPAGEDELVEDIRDVIEDTLDRAADEDLRDVELLQQVIHDDLARFLYKKLRRRPMILPVVIEV
ncbi:MAG: ribonuclease J [Solirubrobacteraceae bacterium]